MAVPILINQSATHRVKVARRDIGRPLWLLGATATTTPSAAAATATTYMANQDIDKYTTRHLSRRRPASLAPTQHSCIRTYTISLRILHHVTRQKRSLPNGNFDMLMSPQTSNLRLHHCCNRQRSCCQPYQALGALEMTCSWQV